MPEFTPSHILVVSKDELVPRFYNTYQALAQALYRDERRGYGLKRAKIGGGGHPLQIEFDSLPFEIQEVIGDPRKKEHILENYYVREQDVVDFYTDFTYPDGGHVRAESLETYITNGCMWRAIDKLKTDREQERMRLNQTGSLRGVMATLCADAASFNPVLKKRWGVGHTLPEAENKFKDRYNLYKEGGLAALLNKNKGNKNAAVLTPETLSLLNNIFGTQAYKPTYEDVASQYAGFLSGQVEVTNQATGEVYAPSEFKPLSRSTIYNYLKTWTNAIGTEARRSGDRQKLMSKFKPGHCLDRPQLSGSLISIDDRNPPFEYAKGCRVWFYLGQDVASGAITTWVWGKDKKSIILDFYRQMVRNYAEWGLCLPAELECESSLNSSFKDTLLKEGNMFQYVRIEPNNARGKFIEHGFNRAIRYSEEKKQEGWIARPFARSESNQAGNQEVPMLPYDDIVELSLKNIETWNNKPHDIDNEKTRWEYFLENQNPKLKSINYKAILPYVGYREKSSVHAGIIRFRNQQWVLGDNGEICFGEQLIGLMSKVEGQNIDILWLDGNNGEVLKALVCINGQLMCEALPIPHYVRARIEQTSKDIKARELMSKYVATIEGFARKQRNAIDRVMVIDNRPVTLNNKFKIPAAQKYRPIDHVIDHDFGSPVEILPEMPDDDLDLIPVETTFKTSIKDRF